MTRLPYIAAMLETELRSELATVRADAIMFADNHPDDSATLASQFPYLSGLLGSDSLRSDEFDESKVTRAKDGKFGSGGGSAEEKSGDGGGKLASGEKKAPKKYVLAAEKQDSKHSADRTKINLKKRQDSLAKAAEAANAGDNGAATKHLAAADKYLQLADKYAKQSKEFAKSSADHGHADKALAAVAAAKSPGQANIAAQKAATAKDQLNELVAKSTAQLSGSMVATAEVPSSPDWKSMTKVQVWAHPDYKSKSPEEKKKVWEGHPEAVPNHVPMATHAQASQVVAQAAASGSPLSAGDLMVMVGEVKQLPPPTMNFTDGERTKKANKAVRSIADSRTAWDHAKTKDVNNLTDAVEPGMTQSARDFAKARLAFADRISNDQVNASVFYSNQGDRVLNHALRTDTIHKESPKVQKLAKDLDAAIDAHPMPEDTVVSRGISGGWAQKFAAQLEPGDVFQEKGYTSTAATKGFYGEVQLKITVPKGMKAAPIPSRYAQEHEYLLPRGTKFRVTGKSGVGSNHVVMHLEVVP